MRFGSWETLRQLGQGGFGEVYLAQRPVVPGSDVMQTGALKVLHAQAGALERRTMANEIERLAQLNHPNLSRFIESGTTEGGEQWFVMDFVEGVGLNQRVEQQGPLTESEWLVFTKTLLGALSYLRANNISHLDIKADNIIRANSGTYTLVDFGLSAKIFGAGQGIANQFCASPEQLGLIDRDESPASDVFSLGICIFYAFTGGHPWLNSQYFDYKSALVSRVPNLSRLPDNYRLWLEPALAISPENRPTAQTLLEELDSLLVGTDLSQEELDNPHTWSQLRERLFRDFENSIEFEIVFSSSAKGRWRFVREVSVDEDVRLHLSSDSLPIRAISPSERANLVELGWRSTGGTTQQLSLDLSRDEADVETLVDSILAALRLGLGLGIENLTIIE